MPTYREEFSPLPDPRSLTPRQFLEKLAAAGFGASIARRVLGQVLADGRYVPEAWIRGGQLARRVADRFSTLPALTLERVTRSPVDQFEKLLFRAPDNLTFETVLIPLHKPGKVSICLSSQIGCVMACSFCATGRMSTRRNLESWEIVDQFVQARKLVESQGRQVTGAVFMGMGEPFLNYERVLTAAELFCFPLDRAISAKAITISTVGLVSEIDRFTIEKRPFRLSISLGAATDEKRERLVPVAARTPVHEVIAAAKRYSADRNCRVNISYVCIRGENVSDEDAAALGALLGDVPVRLDLIEVTDSTGRFSAPTEDELGRFRDALNKHLRQPVVRRYSGGKDIAAACGTLAGARATHSGGT